RNSRNYHRIPHIPCTRDNGAGASHLYRSLGAYDWRNRNRGGNQAAPGNQRRMVPDLDGPGFNCLCDTTFMEPGPRCGDADLDYGVVRSDIRCSSDNFWPSFAQLTSVACALVSRKLVLPLALASAFKAGNGLDPAFDAAGCFIPSSIAYSCGACVFLRDQMGSQWFC